jgi:uncharacterized protein YggT (Ycf19 family)
MFWFLYVLHRALSLYIYIVLFRVLWSWTALHPYNPYVQRAYRPPFVHVLRLLFAMVDPLTKPLRRYIPLGRHSVVDAGPAILILCVIVLQLGIERLMRWWIAP